MFNPFAWSFRAQFLLGAAVCASLLGYALYAQYRLHLEPCPLCIFQRIALIALGLVFLTGGLHAPGKGGRRIYALLALFAAAAGSAVAGRHVWLQSLPPGQVPSCGPDLGYMLNAFPLSKTLKMVFTGSGECAKADWWFLGLSMPMWTLLFFAALGLGALWAGLRTRRR